MHKTNDLGHELDQLLWQAQRGHNKKQKKTVFDVATTKADWYVSQEREKEVFLLLFYKVVKLMACTNDLGHEPCKDLRS